MVFRRYLPPDKAGTVKDMELIRPDITAVTQLHHAIINREPEAVVRELLSKAKRELDGDYQAYLKNM